jgi:hypothetical protein
LLQKKRVVSCKTFPWAERESGRACDRRISRFLQFLIFGCFWDRILGESSSFWEAWNDSSALAAKLLKALSCTWRGSQEGILFRILTPWWILLVSDDDHDFSSRLVSTKARQICSKISKQVEARDFRSNELRPHVMRSSSVLGSGWAEVETAGKNLKS